MEDMDLHRGYPSQAEAAKGRMPLARGERPPAVSDVIANSGLSSKADEAGAGNRSSGYSWKERFEACKKLAEDDGRESVRVFDGRPAFGEYPVENELAKLLTERDSAHGAEVGGASSLPDCWVWMSGDCLKLADEDLTIARGIEQLPDVIINNCSSDSTLEDCLRKDDLRIITVSRARYNPRFRGRMVADPRAAMSVLEHAGLCVATSVPLARYDLENHYLREVLAAQT
jgi:hypothetical protein